MNVQIFREETYPKDLQKLCRKIRDVSTTEKESLKHQADMNEFLQGKCQGTELSSFLCELEQEIVSALESHSITVFQNTRLITEEDILQNGLRFPDEQYERKLVSQLTANDIDRDIIDEILEKLAKYKKEMGETRSKSIYFYYDLDAQDYYQEFFKCFGGELFARATGYCRASDECDVKFRKVVDLGKPYRVRFNIPFSWFNWKIYKSSEEQLDIARWILAYWIDVYIKDQAHDRKRSGWIGVEIPSQNIESVDLIDVDLLT